MFISILGILLSIYYGGIALHHRCLNIGDHQHCRHYTKGGIKDQFAPRECMFSSYKSNVSPLIFMMMSVFNSSMFQF